jgi:pSer/pThr/pTyr-binding forkhead associated (FHA) protein
LPHDVADAAIPGQITYAEEHYAKSVILALGQQVKVGRGLDADIWLDDPAIDLAQAQITWQGSSWVVTNLGTTCATILVSAPGGERALTGEVEIEGGQLRMGDALLTLSPAKS